MESFSGPLDVRRVYAACRGLKMISLEVDAPNPTISPKKQTPSNSSMQLLNKFPISSYNQQTLLRLFSCGNYSPVAPVYQNILLGTHHLPIHCFSSSRPGLPLSSSTLPAYFTPMLDPLIHEHHLSSLCLLRANILVHSFLF